MTVPTRLLASGYPLPLLGLGTWRLTGPALLPTVHTALRLGYRHFDTAEVYGNEEELGAALTGFDRAELFLTSKVAHDHLERDQLLEACRRSLRALRTDYLDLYLIHWPNRAVPCAETFAALAHLVEQGQVRSVGVSNFTIAHLERALEVSPVPLCTNQVEFHPLLYQRELLDFCNRLSLPLTAYAPLARGQVFAHPLLRDLAARYGVTPAQLSLRWLLQKGLLVIPKAGSTAHLEENLAVFDWSLTPEDEAAIDSLGEQRRLIHPDLAEF